MFFIPIFFVILFLTFLKATKNERMHHAFLLMLFAGMRRGEVLALRWIDVKFKSRTLHIQQALKRDKEGFFLTNFGGSAFTAGHLLIISQITACLKACFNSPPISIT